MSHAFSFELIPKSKECSDNLLLRSTSKCQIYTDRFRIRQRAATAIPQRNIIIRQARCERILIGLFPCFGHKVAEGGQRDQLAWGK